MSKTYKLSLRSEIARKSTDVCVPHINHEQLVLDIPNNDSVPDKVIAPSWVMLSYGKHKDDGSSDIWRVWPVGMIALLTRSDTRTGSNQGWSHPPHVTGRSLDLRSGTDEDPQPAMHWYGALLRASMVLSAHASTGDPGRKAR